MHSSNYCSDFFIFGHSGTVESLDALCFLPQNVISEKIFVFLYFWFILLLVISAINFISIFLMLSLKFLRIGDLRRMSEYSYGHRQRSFFNFYSDFGYWFSLHLLHKNLSPVLYKDLIGDLMNSGDRISANPKFNEETEKKSRNIMFVEERSSDEFDSRYEKA